MMLRQTFFSLILVLPLCHFSAYSQCRKEKKDYHWEIAGGIGALPTFLKDRSRTIFLPVRMTFERKWTKVLSAGIYAGYSVVDSEKAAPGSEPMVHFRHRYQTGGLRLTAHINPDPLHWDVYGGFQAGWFESRTRVMEGDASWFVLHKRLKPVRSGVHFSGLLGARYSAGDRLGVFAEAGWCVSLLTLGLSCRF